jgi:hypothetical protein
MAIGASNSGSDMRRYHHANTIIEDGGLEAGRGRLPFDYGISLNNRGFDLFGQSHRNRPFIIHFKSDFHTIGQESRGITDKIAWKSDLFVIFLIHEYEIVTLDIEKLEVLSVEPDTFDGVLAAKANIGLASVDQILHFDLHERPALARLGVLSLGNFPDTFLVFENVAWTNVHTADLHGSCL